MKLSYSEQLKRPEWQKRRLEVMNLAGWKCQRCGDTESMLHVHHKRYAKGRMAWDYELTELETLCEDCHTNAHEAKDLIERALAELPTSMWMDAACVLIGWAQGAVSESLSEEIADPFSEAIGLLGAACRQLCIYDVIDLRERAEALAKLPF